jgi:hypothetical protein
MLYECCNILNRNKHIKEKKRIIHSNNSYVRYAFKVATNMCNILCRISYVFIFVIVKVFLIVYIDIY